MNDNQNIGPEEINPFEEKFQITQKMLDPLGEMSPSGYLLFTINEDGDVEFYTKDMSSVVETGLRIQAIKILSNLNAMEDNSIASQVIHSQMEDELMGMTEEERAEFLADEGDDEDDENETWD